MAPSELRNKLKRTKICRFWVFGRCALGDDCNFAHSKDDLQEQPNLVATELCFQFMSRGTCRRGADCTFAHGVSELRAIDEDVQCRTMKFNMKPDVGAMPDLNHLPALLSTQSGHAARAHKSGYGDGIRPPPGLPPPRAPMSPNGVPDCKASVPMAFWF
ncbi:unnamed protein product [Durusdinium trenchii]